MIAARYLLILVSVGVVGVGSIGRAELPPAQYGTQQLECRPQYLQGDKRSLLVTRERIRDVSGKPQSTIVAHTEIQLKVLAADQREILIEWVRGETVVEGLWMLKDPHLKAIASLVKGLRFEVQLDGMGRFVQLRNWEEIRSVSDELLEQLIQLSERVENEGEHRKKPDPERVRSAMKEFFSSRENIEAQFLADAMVYFMPVGLTYRYRQPLSYNGYILNLLGGRNIPQQGHFTLEEIDEQKSMGTVRWASAVEEGAARDILGETLASLVDKFGGSAEKEQTLTGLEMKTAGTFKVDLSNCWVSSAKLERNVRATAGGQVALDVEKVRITVPPDHIKRSVAPGTNSIFRQLYPPSLLGVR